MIKRFDPSRSHRLALLAALPALALALPGLVRAEPKAHVEPAELQLGEIEEGNQFERYIELENVGDDVLVLEDVKTSCGCTAAALDGDVELQPGEKERIRITFNSRGMEGAITKKVTVVTNDPEHRMTEVLLKANVHRPVRWEPRYLSVEGVSIGDPYEATVTLETDADLDLQVTDAFVQAGPPQRGPSQLFDVDYSERRMEEGRHAVDFTVHLREKPKPQRVYETLMIATNQADRDTIRVPIRGEIRGRIQFRPSYAVLPMVAPGEEARRDVVLNATEGTFEVLSAAVPDSPVQVELVPKDNGKVTTVRLSYVGEENGANGVRQLHIETDDPDQAVIEIPVRYQTRPAPAAQTTTGG
jgi:hypothetical protein